MTARNLLTSLVIGVLGALLVIGIASTAPDPKPLKPGYCKTHGCIRLK